jgi:hypothetical protein
MLVCYAKAIVTVCVCRLEETVHSVNLEQLSWLYQSNDHPCAQYLGVRGFSTDDVLEGFLMHPCPNRSNLTNELEGLEAMRTAGVDVRYIELGNEVGIGAVAP